MRWTPRRFWIATGVVFAVAFAIRLAYVMEVGGTVYADERNVVVDAKYYDMRATEIAEGNLLGDAPAFLSPIYCYMLGLVYAFPGDGLHVAKVVQAFLGAFSCVLLYWIGRRIFSDLTGCIAAGMLAFYGLHIYYTGVLLPAVTVVLLNLLFVWALVAGGGTPSWKRYGVAGLLLGLATGAKANAILLLPATALWIWIAFRRETPRRRLGWWVALAAGAAAAIAPITARNYHLAGSFVLVTTSGGRNLYKGNGPDANGTHVFLPSDELGIHLHYYIDHHPDIARLAVDDNREMSARAWRYMREHPARTAGLFLRKFGLLFHRLELGTRDQYYFARTQFRLLALPWLTFGLFAPIGLAGWALVSRRRNLVGKEPPFADGPLHAVLLVQIASFVLVFVLARYRLVLSACLMLFGSRLIEWVADRVRARDYRELGLVAALLAIAVAFVHLPEYGFTRDRGVAHQHMFLGDMAYLANDYDNAIDRYRRAIDADWLQPDDPKWQRAARERLGVAQVGGGRLEDARVTFSTLLDELVAESGGESTLHIAELRQLLEALDQQLRSNPNRLP